jgi:hypothetical protein
LIWRSVVLGFHSALRIPKSALPYATMMLLFCRSGFPFRIPQYKGTPITRMAPF